MEASASEIPSTFATFLEIIDIKIWVHSASHKDVTAYLHLLGRKEFQHCFLAFPCDLAGEYPVPVPDSMPISSQTLYPALTRVPAMRPTFQDMIHVIMERLEGSIRTDCAVIVTPTADC